MADVIRREGMDANSAKRMESIELLQRELHFHYPAFLVFSRGRIRGGVIPGAKYEAEFVRLMKRELASQ